jgi:hypothetical protein
MRLAPAPTADKADNVPNGLVFELISAKLAPIERRRPKKC